MALNKDPMKKKNNPVSPMCIVPLCVQIWTEKEILFSFKILHTYICTFICGSPDSEIRRTSILCLLLLRSFGPKKEEENNTRWALCAHLITLAAYQYNTHMFTCDYGTQDTQHLNSFLISPSFLSKRFSASTVNLMKIEIVKSRCLDWGWEW